MERLRQHLSYGVDNPSFIFEAQYAIALRNVIRYGAKVDNERTGVGTYAVQHQYFRVENVQQDFPMIKAKKVFPKMALKELFWFMNGRSDIQWLEERGVNYWKDWADTDGSVGKTYGYQFRNFNGVDNFYEMLNGLASDPMGRRHILNLWNPADLKEMRLPPCVLYYRFAVIPDPSTLNAYFLDIHVNQRSADSFIGVPYDIMMDAWFLEIVAHLANVHGLNVDQKVFVPRTIHHTCEDFHIYQNHLEQAKQYLDNFEEDRNNVIKQDVTIDINMGRHELPVYLDMADRTKYRDFKVNYLFDKNDIYPHIKADIAV